MCSADAVCRWCFCKATCEWWNYNVNGHIHVWVSIMQYIEDYSKSCVVVVCFCLDYKYKFLLKRRATLNIGTGAIRYNRISWWVDGWLTQFTKKKSNRNICILYTYTICEQQSNNTEWTWKEKKLGNSNFYCCCYFVNRISTNEFWFRCCFFFDYIFFSSFHYYFGRVTK